MLRAPARAGGAEVMGSTGVAYRLRWWGVLAIVAVGWLAVAEEPAAPDEATARRYEAFRTAMTNVRLVGRFTIAGPDEEKLHADEYVVTGVTKVGTGDGWLVAARIRYGEVDLTVPVPVEVKWAGDTPVITLEKITIPGLGTFSSRVVIDGRRYAGTWSHDAVGGHMFGTIEPVGDAAAER